MRSALILSVAVLNLAPAVSACGILGGGAEKVESGLKDGLSRAYGPVESVSCEHSNVDVAEIELFECSVRFADGRVEKFCGFRANGVPGWDRGRCLETRIGQS
jgi:hypothetical protein